MKKTYLSQFASLSVSLTLTLSTLLSGLQIAHANQDLRPAPIEQGRGADDTRTGHRSKKLSPELEPAARGLASGGGDLKTILQVRDASSQNLKQLLKRHGIRVRKQLQNLQMLGVELPASVLEELAQSDEVEFVSTDRGVAALGHLETTTGAAAVRNQTDATGRRYTLDGSGIGIAILDSGIYKDHESVKHDGSIKVSVDFTGERRTDDPFGHGTHVAGLATADGDFTHNAYVGIAPDADLINLRVLDSNGVGTVSGVLSALNWVLVNRVRYNIRVVNMSLGTPAVTSYLYDPICLAVRMLVNAGIVVVAAAGNDGTDETGQAIYGRIHSPGIEPSAITVGCSNGMGTDSRADDVMATYSSRGPTRAYWTDITGGNHYDNLVKPDLVAPGNKVIQAAAKDNYLVNTYPQLDTHLYNDDQKRLMYLSGTSMASPQVAGAVALLLQANPTLTPNLVKAILMYTAQPLTGYSLFEQGAGQLNIEGAVRLAKLVRTNLNATTPLGSSLLTVTTPPVPQSTVASTTFNWAQGVVGNYSYLTGSELITRYQLIFGYGHLLGNGHLLSNGHLLANTTMVTGNVNVGDSVMVSDGYPLGNGLVFLDVGLLLGDGMLLPEGHLLSNGIVQGDGHLLANTTYQSLLVLANGDDTPYMR
jgi:subtilisin family serine protease